MKQVGGKRRGGRIIYPVLTGLLVAGLSFVGIAVASQQAPSAIASTDGSEEIARASELWLRSLTSAAPQASHTPIVLPRSRPVFLDIGAIDMHKNLQTLGLDDAGAIEVPAGSLYDEPGWYRYSPTPGAMGPAIILGHVDSAANGPSSFFRLGELRRGDMVSVTRADGSKARFVVEAVHEYSKDDFPTDVVYGDLDHAGLRLITCGGVFDDSTGHYEDNIVVFGSLIG